ncbi:MAG: hypothetical protein RR190_06115 [Bacteroidales bacterium]
MKTFSQILSTLLCLWSSTNFASFNIVDTTFLTENSADRLSSISSPNTFPFVYCSNVYLATSVDKPYPVFFSLTKEKAYTAAELNIEQAACIDLVFSISKQAFISPDLPSFSFDIPGAKTTKIIRLPSLDLWYEKEWTSLQTLEIQGSSAGIDFTKLPLLYAFETGDGRRALLLLKESNDGYICVDLEWERNQKLR